MVIYNEDSRVKIPALLHCKRLGYDYISKKGTNIDSYTNIFIDVFGDSIKRINNKDYSEDTIMSLIKEIKNLIDNDKDKGKAFYERLVGYNEIKLIDLTNPHNNDFKVVTELTFKGEKDSSIPFRPDITILINGIPLGFIEVKKPNNKDGIQAEFKRMKEERLKNKDNTHFFNLLQVLGFTNNQQYNDDERIKLQGSFYTTPNGESTSYNLFREEQEIHVNEYIDDEFINSVLSDNNIMSIKAMSEFNTNLKIDTPCNKFITSVFSKERLIFFIRYGIVYVDSQMYGLNKHIIRYPQYFAIQELIDKLNKGMKRGIVWHTQGSGKTALSYFITNVLRDYYQEKGIITKFYFVVDRLDLLIQATTEFSDRGMTIASINSKEDFINNIKSSSITDATIQQGKYKETMNVVNIQKFSENSTVNIECDKKIQRIYLLDEVHRGYKPKGTFLANLLGADSNGIFIGLTGTPLLKSDFKSTDLFYDYIHKYYYNKSIADGYTLKIKKENIAIDFRNDIRAMLGIKENRKIPTREWEIVTKSYKFVEKLCKYIQNDFEVFKEVQKDNSLGFMIVTSSSEQAKLVQEWFENNSSLKTALVLYDEDDNKAKQEEFRGKKNKETGRLESVYSGVIVYNMLLTGFDAPRLKRLYLLRQIKEHSLLQTLARVNRPYKNMKYGYVVDFVDITEQYEDINRRYLEELKDDIKDENDDEEDISSIFVKPEKIREQIKEIENKLFNYMANIECDLEEFRKQIEPLEENKLREIKSYLIEYRECYNELRMSHEDVSNIPIDRLNKAFYEVSNRIALKTAERTLDDDNEIDGIDFTELVVEFLKIGEVDLEFTTENDIIERINNIKNALSANCDKIDNEYKNLQKKFKCLIKKFKSDCDTTEKVQEIIKELDILLNNINILNSINSNLTKKYKGDESCMRIHKRLREDYSENLGDLEIYNIMTEIISKIDDLICHMANPSEAVIIRQMLRPVRDSFKNNGHKLSPRQVENIIQLFVSDKFSK